MTQTDYNQRRHERIRHQVPGTLVLATGSTYQGLTKDLSIRGLFLGMIPGSGCEVGAEGTVRLDLPTLQEREFPCRVAFVSEQGVGLWIDQTGRDFGQVVTQALFGEMTANLGGESRDWSGYRVVVQGKSGESHGAKLIKLTNQRADLCMPNHVAPYRHHTEVTLTIGHASGQTAVVHGTIVDTQSQRLMGRECAGTEGHLQVLFAVGTKPDVDKLAGLVRLAHENRLAGMMKKRAVTNTLLSGGDSGFKPRSDQVRDINRFFGYKKK